MEEFNLPAPLHLPSTPAPPLESLILETTSKTSQRIKSQGRLIFFRKEMSKNEFFWQFWSQLTSSLFWFVNNVLSDKGRVNCFLPVRINCILITGIHKIMNT